LSQGDVIVKKLLAALVPALAFVLSACSNQQAPAPTPPKKEGADEEKIQAELGKLPVEDRKIAEEQKFCAVHNENRLGSMGAPVKVTLKGETVFLCCEGCRKAATKNEEQTLAKAHELRGQQTSNVSTEEQAKGAVKVTVAFGDGVKEAADGEVERWDNLAKLAPDDRKIALRQLFCAVDPDSPLGSMGVPVKVVVKGETIFLCCGGCKKQVDKDPEKILKTAKELREKK
jgi:hypothetical protein